MRIRPELSHLSASPMGLGIAQIQLRCFPIQHPGQTGGSKPAWKAIFCQNLEAKSRMLSYSHGWLGRHLVGSYLVFSSCLYTESSKERMWGIWESLEPQVGIKLDVRKRVFSGVQFQCSCGSHWALLWVPFHLRSSVTCRFKGESLAAIFLKIALFKPCIFCWVPHKHKPMQPGTEWNIQPFHSPAVFPGCLAYGSTRYACQ